eukprot:6181247-Pleurochrysis_carterae.AAC.1
MGGDQRENVSIRLVDKSPGRAGRVWRAERGGAHASMIRSACDAAQGIGRSCTCMAAARMALSREAPAASDSTRRCG